MCERAGASGAAGAAAPAASISPAPALYPHSQPLQIGCFALLAVELIAGKGILELVGVTTGKGLGFEF